MNKRQTTSSSSVTPESSSVYVAAKNTTNNTSWSNIQNDNKKHDDINPLSFPITKKYRSCCSCLGRFCSHSLVSTNKHILRKEREQVRLHMQPIEEEEMETKTDKNIEYVVDSVLMGFCLKKPKSCCGRCASFWKHPVAVWSYRFWQLAVILYFGLPNIVQYGIGNLLCMDSSLFGSTTGRSFRCPAVQEQLRLSNHTKHINGYAGMMKTMKALEDSNLESTWLWSGTKFSVVFNTSNIDSETGYPENYEEFLVWHAETSSFIPSMFNCMHICIIVVMIGSTFLIFQKDDPNEIMFPPLLEAKDMGQDENADVEIGNKELLHSQSFHFVRPKRLVLQASLWCSFGVFWSLMFHPVLVGFNLDMSWIIEVAIVQGIFFLGPLGGPGMSGLLIQNHNATTLSNILVQLCSMENLLSEQRQAKFEQWKDYYKTALHIWSRRVTPVSVSILLTLGIFIIHLLVSSIFSYTAIISEPDIPESKRMQIFLKSNSGVTAYVIMFTITLFITFSLMAMISVRYKRLNLLVATLRLPTHQLDDFEILQKQNAALTICGIPITTNTVRSILYLLFIQTALVGLTVAGS